MKTLRNVLLALTAVVATAPVIAQTAANVHGKVVNPAGQPFANAEVKFTKDKTVPYKDEKFAPTVTVDAQGNYTAKDVAPGDYFVYVTQGEKMFDRLELTVKAGDDKTLDFDMTRAEYQNAMSPEEKKALEEYKKKNAEAVQANKQVANLNATLQAVRADLAKNAPPVYGDVSKDVSDMKAAVDSKPDESILWLNYGNALAAQGDHLAKVNRDAKKTPVLDDDVKSTYSQAVDAYKKGIDLNVASKKPSPVDQASGWNGIGNTLAKEGKGQEASDAFENAVKAAPTNAGMFYGNEAAVLFNAGQTEAAAAAADKAIAADPNRPDPYFVKGQALIAKSSFDAKAQKIVPPPGCVDAYQHYLSLAPDGQHAAAVKEVLASLGEKVDTHYSAGKKR
ncbi:MAG TPA: carboxypeptidase-like regulatory domain-containing protein [Acidobacteriaceae bacterium]|jgi:tetratricopeptide (TPR) repeat protein|nr:carboxypeptidase-like regulatory domain-containing protein [Acidobacteriaceae bacterium]